MDDERLEILGTLFKANDVARLTGATFEEYLKAPELYNLAASALLSLEAKRNLLAAMKGMNHAA